jgi:hypothetical protein
MVIHAFSSWSLVGRSAMQAQKFCLGTLIKPSPFHCIHRTHFSIAMSNELKNANSEQDRESVPAAKGNHYSHQDRSDSTKAIRLKMPKKGQNSAEKHLKS